MPYCRKTYTEIWAHKHNRLSYLTESFRGPIDTKIFRDGEAKGLFNSEIISAGTLMGRMGQAEEVAKVLVFLLSEEASYVTGGTSQPHSECLKRQN